MTLDMKNEKIAKILNEIAMLQEIKGEIIFKPRAYRRAALIIEKLEKDVLEIYKQEGLNGLKKITGVGQSVAEKIEEFLKKKKIKYYEDLKEEQAIRVIITHYFETKGVSLDKLKKDAKKRKIIYSRFTKPAKQLIELTGSVENAKKAITKVADWAKSRKLDYAIETVFKKWLELDTLKPKEIVKKPFFQNRPIIWSQTRNKWYVLDKYGEWLEFAGKKEEIEWRVEK